MFIFKSLIMNDKNTKIVIPDEIVIQKVFLIRGRKVLCYDMEFL